MVDASVPVGLPSISLFRALVDSLTQSVRLPRELGSHVYGGEKKKLNVDQVMLKHCTVRLQLR